MDPSAPWMLPWFICLFSPSLSSIRRIFLYTETISLWKWRAFCAAQVQFLHVSQAMRLVVLIFTPGLDMGSTHQDWSPGLRFCLGDSDLRVISIKIPKNLYNSSTASPYHFHSRICHHNINFRMVLCPQRLTVIFERIRHLQGFFLGWIVLVNFLTSFFFFWYIAVSQLLSFLLGWFIAEKTWFWLHRNKRTLNKKLFKNLNVQFNVQ